MRDFLGDGMKVKVTMMLRGRENAHPEYGNKLMQKIIEDLQGCSRPEVMPKLMGRSITMMISPVRGGKKTGEAQDEEEKEA
jgi:translation initiation factor IF-3